MTDKHFAAFKVPLVSGDELRIARQRGENISYTEDDRHIEAYQFNNMIYIAGVKDIGPKE